MEKSAFQDIFAGSTSYCWGCGCNNQYGLQLKSYWAEDGEGTICVWRPQAHHTAAWPDILSGGIIASLIDCHSVCTAMMVAHRDENVAWSSEPAIIYITASLQYLKPTSMAHPVTLRATVREQTERKMRVECGVFSQDEVCARGEVIAVRLAPKT